MNWFRNHDTDVYAVVLLVYQLWHSSVGGILGPVAAPGKVDVMIVEESDDRRKVTKGQYNAIMNNDKGGVRDWCRTHCEPGGFRLVDKDDDVSRDTKWSQDAFGKWKTDAANKVPWLVVIHPSTTFSGPLPDTAADTLALVQTYGGK
jgi:hypothetical protein